MKLILLLLAVAASCAALEDAIFPKPSRGEVTSNFISYRLYLISVLLMPSVFNIVYIQCLLEACTLISYIKIRSIINPRRACAARVTVVVLCVCMCVCVCVHSYLPPHTLESQKRDTNGFCAIQGSF